MKKMIIFLIIALASPLGFGASLNSMSKAEFEKAFVGKTFTSIATDNLNGRTIDNTFSMYLDNQGNIWGKMAHKPVNEPQTDKGVYTVAEDGTFYITWEHWDGAKKLCGRVFNTKNAYISVDCDDVFHTVFMKETDQNGRHL